MTSSLQEALSTTVAPFWARAALGGWAPHRSSQSSAATVRPGTFSQGNSRPFPRGTFWPQ